MWSLKLGQTSLEGLCAGELWGIMQHPQAAKYHGLELIPARFRSLCRKVTSITLLVVGAVSVHAGQLSLTWQDNSDNEDGFEIERALLGESYGLLAAVGPDNETYLDEAVVPGIEYEYRVRAFNAFGYSGYTNVSVGMMPNTAPILGEIGDISVLKGEALPVAEFTFSDAESPASDLVVEAVSSNLALVPLEGLAVSLSEGTGTVSVSPASTATGSAVVTLMLSDGVELVQKNFKVEVAPNLAPTIAPISSVAAFDSQQVGPIPFTVSDSESAASELLVVGDSLDQSLIASESITIGGTGANRTVSFATKEGVSGVTTIRLAVSDGVNTTNGAIRVSVSKNSAPVISGLVKRYTINANVGLSALAFVVSDSETAASDLDVSVRSSNSLIVSSNGLKLKGTGGQRTLDVTPNPGMTGVVEITVSVSDGVRSVDYTFELRVLAPEQIVKILGFTIDQGLAVIEVENRPNATFALWKIHSLDGAWQQVVDVEVQVDANSTTLIDPTPIDSPVCYRVIGSE